MGHVFEAVLGRVEGLFPRVFGEVVLGLWVVQHKTWVFVAHIIIVGLAGGWVINWSLNITVETDSCCFLFEIKNEGFRNKKKQINLSRYYLQIEVHIDGNSY